MPLKTIQQALNII